MSGKVSKLFFTLLILIALAGAAFFITDILRSGSLSSTDTQAGNTGPLVPVKPVSTRYAGAYYMSKPTSITHQWWSIYAYEKNHPELRRRPLLGYYGGHDTEAMDWQIKWAVEGGLSYFVFNSYWTDGQKTGSPYDESIRSFQSSNYNNMMEYAVMITNISAQNQTEAKNTFLGTIAKSYKNNYTTRTNYLKYDNKPVIYIYNLGAVFKTTDVTSIRNTLKAFETTVGKDIYWVYSTPGSNEDLDNYKSMGFDALHPYYVLPAILSGPPAPTYTNFINTQLAEDGALRAESRQVGLKYIPSVTTNFDEQNRYYHDTFLTETWRYTTNVSKSELNRLLSSYDNTIKATSSSDLFVGNKEVVGIGAWNEWIEGNYLEPGYTEFSKTDPYYMLKTVGKSIMKTNFVATQTPVKDYSVASNLTRFDWNFGKSSHTRNWYKNPTVSDFQVESADVYSTTIAENAGSIQILARPNFKSLSSYNKLRIKFSNSCPLGKNKCIVSIIASAYVTNCNNIDASQCGNTRDIKKVEKGIAVTTSTCTVSNSWYTCDFDLGTELNRFNNNYSMDQLAITMFTQTTSPISVNMSRIQFVP